MSRISIRRPHGLTPKQAKDIANQVAADLATEYGIETTWCGNSIRVSGNGLSGELKLAPELFELDLKLNFILGMFKDKIESEIEAEFDKLLNS